jgi:NAD-dependent deacetylase
MPSTEELAGWVSQSKRIVAFTGAGISTESGIPDFRSPGGVWSKYAPVYYQDFLDSAEARHEYWRQKCEAHREFAEAEPNIGHQTLAQWETAGRLQAVVTQNIDGLHQAAGSEVVLELHGTARAAKCLSCTARFDIEPLVAEFLQSGRPPDCPTCGGLLKHATVSFGQPLPTDVLREAFLLSKRCDLFLAIGSSLVVHPAAMLPEVAKQHGAKLVIINRDETPLDYLADAIVLTPIGQTLEAINRMLSEISTPD